jgi:hypothetical protein
MNLTPGELRLLRRLQKEEHNWRYTRWFLIVGAAFLAAAYGWILWKVYATSEGSPEFSNFLLALAYPKVLFGLTMAALFLAWALRDWTGRPARGLLLKLIEEHQTDPERKCCEPGAPPAKPLGEG